LNLQTSNATVRGSPNNPIEGGDNRRDEGTSDDSSGKRWQQQEAVAAATAAVNGNHQRRRTLDDAAVQWKEGSVRASDRRKGRDALTKPPR